MKATKRFMLFATLLIMGMPNFCLAEKPGGVDSITKKSSVHKIFVYNKHFAERFGLNVNKAEPLDKGLEAVEFIIKHHPHPKRFQEEYTCEMNLYVDSNLDLKYPDGPVGDMKAFNDLTDAALAPLKKISDADLSVARNITNYPGTLIVSPITKKVNNQILPVNFEEFVYNRYRKNLVPGISYFGYGIGGVCLSLTDKYGEMNLWLEKRNGTDYSDIRKVAGIFPFKKSDFYIFRFPNTILKSPILKLSQKKKR